MQKAASKSPTTTSTGAWIEADSPRAGTAVLSSATVTVSLFWSSTATTCGSKNGA